MIWEPQNPDVLWLDFSTITLIERTVHTIDDMMRVFSLSPEKYQKGNFRYNEKEYGAHMYPSKYSKLRSDDFSFSPPIAYPDAIRYLFHIDTPFVVIMPEKDRITDQEAHGMTSEIIQAAQSSSFFYPIFFNIPYKEYYRYIGVSITDKLITHFYSSTEWWHSKLDNYQNSYNFFTQKLGKIDSILYSSRRFLEIDNKYFGKESNYTYSSFYSVVNSDPINKLRILFQWNRSPPDAKGPMLSNASYLKLSVVHQTEGSPETPLHIYVNRRSSLEGKDEFKIWKTERLNSRIYSLMNNIFHSSSNPKPCSFSTFKGFFKSAPEKSLLEKISIEIAEMRTLANFCSLWCEFLKNIRYCADNLIPIPYVDDSVDFKYCLIYQNLQVINSYIRNGEKYCIAENIFEQYVELYRKAKEKHVLQTIVIAFKNQNGEATFEDFKKLLLTKNSKSTQTENDEDETINEDIFDVWNKADQCQFKFNKEENIEFALDYLEGLKPSEVQSQIVLILFDIAIRDISKRAPIEIPYACVSYDNLVELFKQKRFASSLVDFKKICRAIEETTLRCEIVNSALSKIPSANFVNQLFEKGYCSIDNPEEIQSVSSLIEVMNIDDLLLHTTINEFIFTGKTKIGEKESNHYLFVSYQRPGQDEPDKYVMALAYQDSM